jgi:hypothetical protein
MNVAPAGPESKHLFGIAIDIEQVFVVGCPHGEHRFDGCLGGGCHPPGVTPVPYNGADDDDREDPPMTALLTAPEPTESDLDTVRPLRPELRLVQAPSYRGPRFRPAADDGVVVERSGPPRRRASAAVRRRRTLLAMMGLALALLALPLGGFGGTSHTAESALAAHGHPVTYVVRAGDTLWSIAERVDPTGDPRPVVSQLAAELGTDTVIPGEQLTLP